MTPLARLAGATAVVGAGCVAYGSLVEREWYRLRELRLPGVLPAGSRPIRLLHLSDLHLDHERPRRVEFLRSLTGLDADLVVMTGDLCGAIDIEDEVVAAMRPLTRSGTPGLVVLGSNDVFGPKPKSPAHYFFTPDDRKHGPLLRTEHLISELAASGWTTLRNETHVVELRDGRRVAVGAIDDPHMHETVLPSASALESADPDAVLQLGLVHAPYLSALDLLAGCGYRVILSGHTHGGQVRFPPVGALVANCDLPLDRVRGPSRHGRAWLHVSPGLGTSTFAPFRFACRPEATLLELVAESV